VKEIKFILDSYALLAYFQAESGGEKVYEILKKSRQGNVSTFVSIINLGEIYYIIARKRGKAAAKEVIQSISSLPVSILDASTERVFAAAEIKSDNHLSYADAFVASAALELSSVIVTGDPEFKALESYVSILWI
jgi:uncharacterized protein